MRRGIVLATPLLFVFAHAAPATTLITPALRAGPQDGIECAIANVGANTITGPISITVTPVLNLTPVAPLTATAEALSAGDAFGYGFTSPAIGMPGGFYAYCTFTFPAGKSRVRANIAVEDRLAPGGGGAKASLPAN